MNRSTHFVRYVFFVVLCVFFLEGAIPNKVDATLIAVDSKVLADSEEDFSRRIYSYDMVVDSQGTLHIIYSKPLGERTAEIFYVRRVGGTWQSPILLSSNGFRASISTFLVVGNDGCIHICYLKDEGNSESLCYRTINNGNVTAERYVDGGGWHSRMQLDAQGYPVFVRDNEDWQASPVVSKLALFTTQDGITWSKSFLSLPNVLDFRIADFLFENGVYHITYGDSAYVNPVFHNLHYATSQDGKNWVPYTIDSSGTLYTNEFWTSLVLDGGHPVISMYKYAEYGNQYNTGTSALLSKWRGTDWQNKIITNTTYPNSREGMGVGLVVNGTGDYFGAWDYSPDDTHDDNFRGARGNIALARSGSAGDWSQKTQIAPFSLEGAAKLRIHGGKLFFLALGDHVDAKLYFYEYNISDFGGSTTPSFGKAMSAIYLLLK
jgi:hypothetical protein